MPKILVTGELVDISQQQYDALGQGTPTATTATDATAYEQYALLQAKIEGVKQLATADASVVDATNISSEFQAELDSLQAQANAIAGNNLEQFQTQYQDDAATLRAQGATNIQALRQELLEDPQPAIIRPGAVPVSTETIVVSGEEITEINTTNNSPQQDTVVISESLETQSETVDPAVDPQAAVNQDTVVPADQVEIQPQDVAAENDPEVAAFQDAEPDLVPVSDIDVRPRDIALGDDPGIPEITENVSDAMINEIGEPVSRDPTVLAQADNIISDDVALDDIGTQANFVDTNLDPQAFEINSGPQSGFYSVPPETSPRYNAVYNQNTGTYDVIDTATGQVADTALSFSQAERTAETANTVGDPAYPLGLSEVLVSNIDTGQGRVVNDTGGVPVPTFTTTRNLATQTPADLTVSDTGGLPAQSLTDIDGDTGFVPNSQPGPVVNDPQGNQFVFNEQGELVPGDSAEADRVRQLDAEAQINPYSLIESRSDPTLTDEEIDAARADQEIFFGPEGLTAESATDAARIQAQVAQARAQQTVQEQRKNANTADWRVRLRLAPQATYLYRDSGNEGILAPLVETDGVIFPYTPTIQTVYKANYNAYDLTHSNYRGYFYQGSTVDDIQITGTFTAQDTNEADYLLAVIHFFRSVTKMFYGQDPNRGAPPPLVFLSGFGEYQFNEHPCVVSQFNYNLPADVDYIRARSPNINGTNMLKRRTRQDLPTNPFSSALARLKAARLPKGAQRLLPPVTAPTLGLNSPTYVPTKIDITIVLHPMQTRQQVSKQFAVRDFAPGRLQRGGFW